MRPFNPTNTASTDIAKLSGEPTLPQAELKTQAWYFIFQVIQVFLVTTFSSGAAAVFASIANDPSSAPTYLALNLPKASNFYLSYFILQGTASAAKNILNYSDLLEYLFMGHFFDSTPRDKYTRYTRMKGISWGSLYPKFTNMVVIAIAYSCIAPLVLGFAAAGLSLFYLSYRYNLLYVIQTKVDTRGECYARALQQLLTGVYLSTLCLIGLFGVHKAPGPSVLMVLLLFATIIWHAGLNTFIIPLEGNFAVDNDGEIAPLIAAEEGGTAEDGDDEDPSVSHIQVHAFNKLPENISTPMARFLDSYISASRETARSWLTDPSARDLEDEAPALSDEEMKNAYLNPALTSKMPKLWLARDEMGISKKEIEENEKVGIAGTDEGAWLNEDNRVEWAVDDFGKVPVFKEPVRSAV
jgi:calcium permeable stress-gated cation channel